MAGRRPSRHNSYAYLKPFDHEGVLNVVIETPQKSRNKFKYDEGLGIFKLGGVLPMGADFPSTSALSPQHWAKTVIPSTCSCSWTSLPFPAAWSLLALSAL